MADILYLIPRSRPESYRSDPADVSVPTHFVDESEGKAEVVTARQFGNRIGYRPTADDEYDESLACRDAQYLETNAEELNIVLRDVAKAKEELSVQIAVVRGLPRSERTRSNIPPPLHDLCVELFKGRTKFQEFATPYAKLVVEIEERIENAQRYIVEHAAR
jgi:hypothetical protein